MNIEQDSVYESYAEVAKDLQRTMDTWTNLRMEARQQAREYERRMNYVRSAVAQGQWWLLEDVLEAEQIELLCEVEPSDRLSLLDEPWE